MKCVVVDNSEAMRPILARATSLAGFADIVEATSAEAGLRAFDSGVDLVVVDWTIGPDAVSRLVAAIKAYPQADAAVFVVASKEELESAKKAGMTEIDGYITKPFSPAGYREAIEKVFANRVA